MPPLLFFFAVKTRQEQQGVHIPAAELIERTDAVSLSNAHEPIFEYLPSVSVLPSMSSAMPLIAAIATGYTPGGLPMAVALLRLRQPFQTFVDGFSILLAEFHPPRACIWEAAEFPEPMPRTAFCSSWHAQSGCWHKRRSMRINPDVPIGCWSLLFWIRNCHERADIWQCGEFNLHAHQLELLISNCTGAA